MGDSVQEKDDDVWYPTEDIDEMDSNIETPQAGFASHSNLHTSQFPKKSPVIYSASTYMINNERKRKDASYNVTNSERPAEVFKVQINNTEKKKPAQFTTLNVATVNNSPIFNVQKTAKQQQTRPLPAQNFYAQQPTHNYQQLYSCTSTIFYVNQCYTIHDTNDEP
jgi:hypothetical protein